MNHRFLSIALFTLYLPHLIAAQCSSCNSFSAALKSCQTPSINTTEPFSPMDTETVHCMCVSSSNLAEMLACDECDGSSDTVTVNGAALIAWYDTCNADEAWGDQQAVACWETADTDALVCLENTVGNGSGTTPGGPGAAASSTGR